MKSKKIAAVLAGVLAVQMMAATVGAEVVEVEEGIRYKLNDGRYYSGWVTKNAKTYYFNAEGYALQGWYKINDETYYFDHNGVMADGFVEINNKLRYFDEGKLVKGEFLTFDVEYEDGGKGTATYYASTSGKIATGWRKLNGEYYHFDIENGVMDTGWAKVGNNYYYFGKDGKMCITKVEIGGKVYTFAKNGKYTGIEGEEPQEVVQAPAADIPDISVSDNKTVAITKPVEVKQDTKTEEVKQDTKPAGTTKADETKPAEPAKPESTKVDVILNEETKCIHLSDSCSKVKQIKADNRVERKADISQLAKQGYWACSECAENYITVAPKPSNVSDEDTSSGTWDEATMSTPQVNMMIQMVENYTQVKLSDKGKIAMAAYVKGKIAEVKRLDKIDAAWYMTFIDGAFIAVGTEFPADKRAALVAKLKKQSEDDFKTIYSELIK